MTSGVREDAGWGRRCRFARRPGAQPDGDHGPREQGDPEHDGRDLSAL
jgi:hypothetical protein